jgi:arsenate reductase
MTMTDTEHCHRPDLSIDQRLALRTAASRLREEFEGLFGTETVPALQL